MKRLFIELVDRLVGLLGVSCILGGSIIFLAALFEVTLPGSSGGWLEKPDPVFGVTILGIGIILVLVRNDVHLNARVRSLEARLSNFEHENAKPVSATG